MKEIVLASGSPRRKEILENLNIDFKIIKSDIDEDIDKSMDPITYSMLLSFLKAEDIASKNKGIIIGADTVVSIDGEILGKPRDKKDAIDMLNKLNGNKHKVITGISLIDVESNIRVVDYEESFVYFRDLTHEEILSYVKVGESFGKAGSYAIQGYGGLLVEKIEGCYFNIVGLPISKLNFLLKSHFDYSIL
ncbi:MAG TPA: Maf family protein [Tissierellaceae bacterium]